jgi:hypothetical protein
LLLNNAGFELGYYRRVSQAKHTDCECVKEMRLEKEEKKKALVPRTRRKNKVAGIWEFINKPGVASLVVAVSTECLLDGRNCPKWLTRSHLSRSGRLHCVTRHNSSST